MVFSMAAEIDWGLISARTKEALRARRASGLPVGRPKGPGKSKMALTPHRYKKSHSVFVRISRFRCALTGTLEFFPVESTDKRQFAQFGVL